MAMADSTGHINTINTYDPYGLPGSSNIGRFQYVGQPWLTEVGLYYNQARMYSPTLGRFLQTDPHRIRRRAELVRLRPRRSGEREGPDGAGHSC